MENAGRPEGRSEEFRVQAVEAEKYGEKPTTDIEAVLTVINRRSEESRELEISTEWHLDLRRAVLRDADLHDAHLEGASLWDAHLEGAELWGAHLTGANLWRAYLTGANLRGAHLEDANLRGARLGGADLRQATGLTDLAQANGDARTRLPDGVARPAHWPPQEPEEDPLG